MRDFWRGIGITCLYFLIAAPPLFVLRKMIRIPDELFRKLLHFLLQFAYIFFAFAFTAWWQAVAFGCLIVLVAYPAFVLLGRLESFSAFVNERRAGEFKNSLLLAVGMLSVCYAVCWGWLGDRYFALACLYAWGIGDGFAALVGKRFGKRHIKLKFADHRKTVEGSLAMFLTSAVSVAAVLMAHGHAGVWACILVPVAGAGVTTFVEMITPNGMDTVTCPTAAMTVMIPLMFLLGGFA